MRIVIKSGTAEQVLCDGHVDGVDRNVGPSNLRTSGPISVQVAEYLRGTAAKPINRQNRKSQLSFSVTRECASAQAAEKLCIDYPATCLRSGTLTIKPEGSAGAIADRKIADAAVANISCEQIGSSVVITFDIVGGAIT
jgi:hypothetical protein